MLLAIDIGNTNITLGLFKAGRPDRDAPGGDARAGQRRRARAPPRRPPPARRRLVRRRLGDRLRLGRPEPHDRRSRRSPLAASGSLVVATAGTVPLAIRTERPQEVGADRLVNALAAARLHGTPAVVVDFGTATTLDCVAADGAYVGGAIAPGLELGLEALAARTAKLPRIELRTPDRAIGRDTVSAMQSGTIFGYQALAAGLLARVRRELADAAGIEPADVKAILTGGLSAAPWARGPRGHRCDRPRPDAQGPRDPPRRGERRRAARARPPPMTGRLAGRLVALGVTGSIAAYKSVELLRLLQAEGADVDRPPVAVRDPLRRAADVRGAEPARDRVRRARRSCRTAGSATSSPPTRPTRSSSPRRPPTGSGRWPTASPATRSRRRSSPPARPVVVAPAMDGDMWSHPATQENVRRLRDDFGYAIVEPDAGPLASGQVGVGRLAELPRIVDAVVAAVADRPIRAPDPAARPPRIEPPREADLTGRHVLVTAGGTAEPIDPVRFIGNRSTGKMGVAIAEAALERGARVTLVVGHVTAALPGRRGDRPGRDDGRDEGRRPRHPRRRRTSLVMAAAVADFRPVRAAPTKLTRDEGLTLELEPTEDILAGAAAAVAGCRLPASRARSSSGSRPRRAPSSGPPTSSAGRASTCSSPTTSSEAGSGFGTDTNRVTILAADGERGGPPAPRQARGRGPPARSRRAGAGRARRRRAD